MADRIERSGPRINKALLERATSTSTASSSRGAWSLMKLKNGSVHYNWMLWDCGIRPHVYDLSKAQYLEAFV